MATKDNLFSSVEKQYICSNKPSDVFDARKYANLNLNYNHKCTTIDLVSSSSNSTPFNGGKSNFAFDRIRDDLQSKSNSKSWNKNGKSSFYKSLNRQHSEDNVFDNQKLRKSDKSANSSTLSLHIAAYEDYVTVENKQDFHGKSFCSRDFANENLFEFPRQQDNEAPKPEVMQFKASQKVLNPNDLGAKENHCPAEMKSGMKKPSTQFYFFSSFFLSTRLLMKKPSTQLLSSISRRFLATTTSLKMPGYKVLALDTLNPNVKTMEYAVRGPLVIRAVELEKELAQGAQKPYKNVIKANIGDAHAMGQKPITFIRQVLACVAYPEILQNGDMPSDVKEHAKAILGSCGGGSTGAYSQSTGIEIVRQHVAKFIERRDGVPADSENICLSGGASESIRNVLKLFINRDGKKAGIMIPIPQYPLYSASIEEFNLGQVGYYLDEDNNWGLDPDELRRSYAESKDKYEMKAIVIINPGNPTGQVLSKENIEKIIKFAHEHKLMILADEVYQDNIYGEGCAFYSFKKVLTNMGEPYSKIELASFHSVSKGYMGECGMRGGYVEFVNVDPAVYVQYKKMISAKLCSTTLGQAVIDCVVNPPKEGDPSYDQWLTEKNEVLKSLKERATLVKEAYSNIEGISVNPVQGAMYAFPKIELPQKAIEKAKSLGQAPDFFYAMRLLEETGICIVPGSGFGQRDGTYHFRTTILPQPELMKDMLERFERFQTNFLKENS